MSMPDRATRQDILCPDCREVQQPPDDRHASGCSYDTGPIPTGMPYQVTAPDGTIVETTGRHLHPVHAVLAYSHHGGVWQTFSSHTTVDAAQWRIDRNEIRGLTLIIVPISHG